MPTSSIALLADRGVVSVTGEDAGKLLQGLLTNDLDLLDSQPAMHAGLLSPQGKILFEFLVVKAEGGYLIDVAREKAADLVKRLTMYKLRAKVEIKDVSDTRCVLWAPDRTLSAPGAVSIVDPRKDGLGRRTYLPLPMAEGERLPEATYHARRIAAGVAEAGRDYDWGDAFPHEALFDLNGGVSFGKGCYVGQEIVSRMEHRGTVKKRVARVTGAADLPASRPDVMLGDVTIGRLGSVAGREGLALVRLDRVIEAIDKGQAITAGGIELQVDADAVARQRRLMAVKAKAGETAP